jgi:hypothetical protein
MSGEIFLYIYTKDCGGKPLFCTLNDMKEMVDTGDGFLLFPSKRGARFMIAKDNISRIEVQENKQPKEAK